jgi:hypothetical protein
MTTYVTLESFPNIRFACTSINPEGWNGFAVPIMTTAQVLAAVRAMQEAERADPWISGAVPDGIARTIRIYYGADDHDILTIRDDGTVRWDGWQWCEVLAPTLPCETCGAVAGDGCADDCTTDEATRYE